MHGFLCELEADVLGSALSPLEKRVLSDGIAAVMSNLELATLAKDLVEVSEVRGL